VGSLSQIKGQVGHWRIEKILKVSYLSLRVSAFDASDIPALKGAHSHGLGELKALVCQSLAKPLRIAAPGSKVIEDIGQS